MASLMSFARAGYNVILRDVEQRFLNRAMETIGKNLDREVKKGKLTEAEKPVVLATAEDRNGFCCACRRQILWSRQCRKNWRSNGRC